MKVSDLSNQISLSMLKLNSELLQDFSPLSLKKQNTEKIFSFAQNNTKVVYAAKGDAKYDKEMDVNNDNIVTFNEYVKHLSEQQLNSKNLPANLVKFIKSKDPETGAEQAKINNIGKSLRSYINNYMYSNIIESSILIKV